MTNATGRDLARVVVVSCLVALAVSGCAVGADPAEQPPLAEQQDWGGAVWTWHCARCHDPGRSAPELAEEDVAGYGTAQVLFEYTRNAMPQDEPGSLPDSDYWAVTAELLDRTGLPGPDEGRRLDGSTAPEVMLVPE